MKYIIYYLLILSFLFSIPLQSQEIVVSEYLDASNPNNEWTELLVIQDNLDLRGYKLRDNSSSGSWIGGIIFKDHELWQLLSEGTIIIIHHRNIPSIIPDKSAADGYIQVVATDNELFERYMEKADELDQWFIKALSISASHDFLQILDSQGNHVHSLGHCRASDIDLVFSSMPEGRKLAHNGVIGAGSLSVVPGSSIIHYNMGFDTEGNYTSFSNEYTTLGIPNEDGNDYAIQNSDFWRMLRQPKWESEPTFVNDSPELVNHNGKTAIRLEWYPAESNDNKDYKGYLLLRIEGDELGDFGEPVDGRIYAKGDKIGNAVVVEHISSLSQTFYLDEIDIECGNAIIYRLYIYRYNQSDLENHRSDYDENSPLYARGRQYNEVQYLSSVPIINEQPPKPIVVTPNTDGLFCIGEDVELYTYINEPQVDYLYNWYINGIRTSFGNHKRINLLEANPNSENIIVQYKIETPTGCIAESDIFEIGYIEKPIVKITRDDTNEVVNHRDTLNMCKGKPLKLTAEVEHWDDLTWVDSFSTNKLSFTLNCEITKPSSYYFSAGNQGACGTTINFVVVEVDEDITINTEELSFSTTDINPTSSRTLTIINNDTIAISFKVYFAQPNAVFSYSPIQDIYTLPAGESLVLTIVFTPSEFEQYENTIYIESYCKTLATKLDGKHQTTGDTRLDVNLSEIHFGIQPFCYFPTDTINLAQVGDMDVIIQSIELQNENQSVFNLQVDFPLPSNLAEASQYFVLRTLSASPFGNFTNSIIITYSIGDVENQIYEIPISINIVRPLLEFEFTQIDFPDLALCQEYKDTTMTVKNYGIIDVAIRDNILNNVVDIISPPLPVNIKPDETVTLTLRYTPRDDNDVVDTRIIYTPCSVSQLFKVTGASSEMKIEVPNPFIDFGVVPICSETDFIEKTFILNVQGVAADVEELVLPNPSNFMVFLNEGDSFLGEQLIRVRFLKGDAGIFRDSVLIKFAPCGDERVIRFYGERQSPDFAVDYDVLDFGEIEIGQSASLTMRYSNNSTRFLNLLRQIASPENPFSYDGLYETDINLAVPIDVEDFIEFDFSFTPTELGVFSQEIEIDFRTPCVYKHKLLLQGKSWSKTEGTLSLSLPAQTVVDINQNFALPLNIAGTNGLDLAKAGISRMQMEVNFNSTIMYPKSVRIANNIITNLTYQEFTPGKLSISFDVSEHTLLTDGELVIIEAVSLIGNALRTDIAIDESSLDIGLLFPASTQIEIETIPGEVILTDNCRIGDRIVEIGSEVLMYIEGEQPLSTANFDIIISTVTEDKTSIYMTDVAGNKVATYINESLTPGVRRINVDTSELPSGTYYLIMHSGIAMRSEKLIIVK